MKDDNQDIPAHDVDTKGRIELTCHSEHVGESSVS